MLRNVLVVIGLMILGILLLAQLVEARDDYELGYYCSRNSEYRDAADADDWIERGRASVTDSPMFPDGIRLTAWAVEKEEEFEPGLASAIYCFVVPSWTNYLKIRVRYKDFSKDDKVAGRLWIKTTDRDLKRGLESEEETPFYGDTFVLRSSQTSETVYVPSGRHVETGKLEIHIVAEGKDCLDVKSIRVEYLEEKPARITVVHHLCDDYWYRWPRYRYVYHYYYWGTYYCPRTSLVYECWDWPLDYYWTTWRPWFRIYVRVHCCYPWWRPRRYTVIYNCDPDDPPPRKRALLRRRLKGRWLRVKKQQVRLLPNDHAIVRKHQESRPSASSKSSPVSSSYPAKKQIRGEGQELAQPRTAPQISPSKSVVRETFQTRALRAQEARPKKQVRSGQRFKGKASLGIKLKRESLR